MEVQVKTILTKQISPTMGDESVLINQIKGGSDIDTFPIDFVSSKSYRLSSQSSIQFPLNIFDAISVDKSQCTFIHIYAYNATQGLEEVTSPIKFTLRIGDQVIGKVSQFQFANIEQIAYDIYIDSLEIAQDKLVDLIIVIGGKANI